MFRKLTYKIIIIALFLICIILPCDSVYASENGTAPDGLTVCIDAGHGGENEGALWNDYIEKEMTLITAQAMYEELSRYDGIRVVMTRTEDMDLSLEERVEIASEAGADFFFCLHYNMSAEHNLYGAECWISAFGENYARGYDFANIEMEELKALGLYDRGIKTRLNSKGTNYYGVLRVADVEELPGVIIEHCHLDHQEDEPYYDHDARLREFGRADATAVAKYYGLSSEELGVDYSDYKYEPADIPSSVVRPDTTAPELVKAEFGEVRFDQGSSQYVADVNLYTYDPDCRPLYYSYSTDGGVHYTGRLKWMSDHGPDSGVQEYDNDINISIPVSDEQDSYVMFRVYNLYNLEAESESYYIPKTDVDSVMKEDNQAQASGYEEIEREETDGDWVLQSDIQYFALLSAFILCLVFVVVVMIRLIVMHH